MNVDAEKHAFQGRVVVVTGAGAGIGQAVAFAFGARGATVAGLDVDSCAETAAAVRAAGADFLELTCDVSEEQAVLAAAARIDADLGGCDVLVNNAGIYPPLHFPEIDYASWRRVLGVNLDGPFLVTRALAPQMQRDGWGRVINLVSSSVEFTLPAMAAYKASKLGLVGLTRALAADLGEDGITVNAVSPSITPTPGVTSGPEEFHEIARTFSMQHQAVKRVATAEDVVPTILFLASAAADFVTGQTIYADGGLAYR